MIKLKIYQPNDIFGLIKYLENIKQKGSERSPPLGATCLSRSQGRSQIDQTKNRSSKKSHKNTNRTNIFAANFV